MEYSIREYIRKSRKVLLRDGPVALVRKVLGHVLRNALGAPVAPRGLRDSYARYSSSSARRIKQLPAKPLLPAILVVDIAAACNAKCFFCGRVGMPEQRATGFMAPDLYRFVLAEAEHYGIRYLRLYSTGEPTLHPQFEPFVRHAKAKGFVVHVSTNASRLAELADVLSEVDVLQFSVEGWDQRSYEKLRYPLSFAPTFEEIVRFSQRPGKKPKTLMHLLLTKQTDIYQYVQRWGGYVDEIHVNIMQPSLIFRAGAFRRRGNKLLYEMEPRAPGHVCPNPFVELVVQHDGKIALCCRDFFHELDLGNISSGLVSAFNSEKMQEVRRQFVDGNIGLCADCPEGDRATPADIARIGRELERAIRDCRPRAKISFRPAFEDDGEP